MQPSQIARGTGLAALAALLFGVTAPFLERASRGLGALWATSFLYLGAAAGAGVAAIPRRRLRGPLLRGRKLARVALVALAGGVVAPACLILGLARAGAATASLLLALEAPFTVALAWVFFREHLGRRLVLAAALILAGALVLGARAPGAEGTALGALLVGVAALAWAADNTLSRTLADEDPVAVVALKGSIGAALSAAAALAAGERIPAAAAISALLVVGAFGYGLSVQLYLRAQTLVGAARTASVFATAPFLGAGAALLLGTPWPGWRFPLAAALMLAGVALQALERHSHVHTHAALEHEHMHTHDDGHHTHAHDPMPAGPHTHAHRHEPLTHDHEHSEDLHHRHSH
jgi:drug/metabolite transporter (DMT)-like permease